METGSSGVKGPAALVHTPLGTFPGSNTRAWGTTVHPLLVTVSGKEGQALASVFSSETQGRQEA